MNKLYAGTEARGLPRDSGQQSRDGWRIARVAVDVLNLTIKFGVKYPIGIYDPNLTVAKLYIQGGYPTIRDRRAHKNIAYINSGEIRIQELAAALNNVLK